MADLNDGRLDLPRSRSRFIAFGVVAVVLFGVLTGRLFQLQILEGDFYTEMATATRTVEIAIPAARGLIFDRAGRPIAENVPSWTVKIRPADLPASGRADVAARLAPLVSGDPSEIRGTIDRYRGSPYDLVPVARGISRQTALLIGEQSASLPGVVVEVEPMRQYLDETGTVNGSLLSNVVGYTGPVDERELTELDAQGYLPDDVIGRAGIEASFESTLRGTYGLEVVERDAAGRTGEVIETVSEPEAGTNLMLTIDAEVQRMAEDSLRWGMEAADVTQGVTIVMNPQTGEILAMVSLPAYDNNKFATGISASDFAVYLNDPTRPLRNHAISDIYPPGSTYKLVTALAALEEGVTTPSRKWQTYGCYQIPGAPAGECLYDWNRAGFGRLNLVEAFAESSDTFFYQMAIGVGIDPLATWANELGFGRLSGIQLPAEEEGIIASTEWARQQGREGVFTGELAQAGIGQNVIAVTPLQMLNAYAALANGGDLMRPMIVRGETDATGALATEFAPEVLDTVDADAAHLHTLRIGAREVITTGHAYNIRDLDLPGALSGKTGTAEFGEPTAEGTLPFHSWFVAFLPTRAGADDAELAVLTFSYSAIVPGNVSAEVVKYFLQKYYDLDQDLRLDPNDFSLVTAN